MTINHMTLGEVVKGHTFPSIEYRTNMYNLSIQEYRELLSGDYPMKETILFGMCGYSELNGVGRLTSHDGDTYHLSDQIEGYEIDDDGTLVVYTHSVWAR